MFPVIVALLVGLGCLEIILDNANLLFSLIAIVIREFHIRERFFPCRIESMSKGGVIRLLDQIKLILYPILVFGRF